MNRPFVKIQVLQEIIFNQKKIFLYVLSLVCLKDHQYFVKEFVAK